MYYRLHNLAQCDRCEASAEADADVCGWADSKCSRRTNDFYSLQINLIKVDDAFVVRCHAVRTKYLFIYSVVLPRVYPLGNFPRPTQAFSRSHAVSTCRERANKIIISAASEFHHWIIDRPPYALYAFHMESPKCAPIINWIIVS